MYVSRKVRTTLMQRFRDHGGRLTIEKGDPAQQDLRNLLDHLAILGDIYVQAEDRHAVTYSLTLPAREAMQ